MSRGSVLAGKYRLELLLGEGGMSHVWSAYHLELEVPVAVKLMKTTGGHQRLAERLRVEARAAARLVHPNIVRVFDIANSDAGPFIVLELLTGESLTSRLARGPLRSVQAVQLLLPIADALELAHAHGVVHRDLKPDNVFLAVEGEQIQPKLLDFGIAKLRYAQARMLALTERGTALGSPSYMSPEQVRGDDVDARTDVWSFCVLLYKTLSGKLPFRAPNQNALMDAILHDEPARLPQDGDIDPELASIVYWGLSKDPDKRPASMRELGCRLAQWLKRRGVSEDASGTPLVNKWLHEYPRPAPRQSARADAPTLARPVVRGIRRPVSHTRRWLLLSTAALLVVGASLAATRGRDVGAEAMVTVNDAPATERLRVAAATLPAPMAEPDVAAPSAAEPEPVVDAPAAAPSPAKPRPLSSKRRSSPPQLPF